MKRILVAEDDTFLQKIYKIKLQKEGFDVKIAADGDEAVKISKTFLPDVILMDLVMPVKDGFTAIKEILGDTKLKNTPIIVTSNLGQSEDIKKAMTLGAKDYIIKSDESLSQILEKIKPYLK